MFGSKCAKASGELAAAQPSALVVILTRAIVSLVVSSRHSQQVMANKAITPLTSHNTASSQLNTFFPIQLTHTCELLVVRQALLRDCPSAAHNTQHSFA